MEPYMCVEAILNILLAAHLLYIVLGMENPDLKTPIEKEEFIVASILSLILSLYFLNGFYSYYRQIKQIQTQNSHEIFYNTEEV